MPFCCCTKFQRLWHIHDWWRKVQCQKLWVLCVVFTCQDFIYVFTLSRFNFLFCLYNNPTNTKLKKKEDISIYVYAMRVICYLSKSEQSFPKFNVVNIWRVPFVVFSLWPLLFCYNLGWLGKHPKLESNSSPISAGLNRSTSSRGFFYVLSPDSWGKKYI